MKKMLCLCLCLLCLCACAQGEDAAPAPESDGFLVYYLKHPALSHQPLSLSSETWQLEGETTARRLIDMMRTPSGPEHESLLPQSVTVNRVVVYGEVCVVDLSDGFSRLDKTDKALLSCGIAMTLIDGGICSHVKVTAGDVAQAPLYDLYLTKENIHLTDDMIALTDMKQVALLTGD